MWKINGDFVGDLQTGESTPGGKRHLVVTTTTLKVAFVLHVRLVVWHNFWQHKDPPFLLERVLSAFFIFGEYKVWIEEAG